MIFCRFQGGAGGAKISVHVTQVGASSPAPGCQAVLGPLCSSWPLPPQPHLSPPTLPVHGSQSCCTFGSPALDIQVSFERGGSRCELLRLSPSDSSALLQAPRSPWHRLFSLRSTGFGPDICWVVTFSGRLPQSPCQGLDSLFNAARLTLTGYSPAGTFISVCNSSFCVILFVSGRMP